MRGGVTDAGQTTNDQTVKIELLSQWKLEAEFRKNLGYGGQKTPCRAAKKLVKKRAKIIFLRIVKFCEKIGLIVHITWFYVSNLRNIMLSLFPFM